MNTIQNLLHASHEPPTWQQLLLLQEALQIAVIQNMSTIKVIRKNARPVMIESETLQDNSTIKWLAQQYQIPSYIIAEVLANAQMIWFLYGATIDVSQETLQTHLDKTRRELVATFVYPYRVEPIKQYNSSLLNWIHWFLCSLADTNLVHTLQKDNITRQQMPRWVIRQISLFDMDYKNTFSSLQQRLDFILLNIKEQDRLFWDDYATMIQENGWLPVDDIIWKETTMLSSSWYYGTISTINYEWQKINTLMRIIPWFSPVWLDVMAWLDLPWGNQNYFATIGIQFNEYQNQIVPAIHTIQMSTHNIWSTEWWQLVSIKEPYDSNTVTMKERMRIINAFTNSVYDFVWLRNELTDLSHWWLPAEIIPYLDKNTLKSINWKYTIQKNEIILSGTNDERKKVKETLINAVIENLRNDGVLPLLVSTLNYLFSHWYPAVIIHHASKNMRLQQHNQHRSEKSIISSGENLYTKKAKQLWWIQNSDWDFVITPESYFAAVGNILYWHQYLDSESLMNAKNEIFPILHPATTKLFTLQNTIDTELLKIFIQSPTYNAR